MVRVRSSMLLSKRLDSAVSWRTRAEKAGSVKRSTFIAGLRVWERGKAGKPELGQGARLLIFKMAPVMLFLISTDAKRKQTTSMKMINSQIPLRLVYAESPGFTLPIQKKVVQPCLFPFSSKKLTSKAVK